MIEDRVCMMGNFEEKFEVYFFWLFILNYLQFDLHQNIGEERGDLFFFFYRVDIL